MEEDEFRQLLSDLKLVHCPFSKTILNNHYVCRYSHRHLLAGREIAGCKHPEAQQGCKEMLAYFRSSATFALKIRDKGALPHAKAIRVQVGGLNGLEASLSNPADSGKDIFQTIEAAKSSCEGIEGIPVQPIIQAITAFKGRKKR